ncbi:fumarylacetoacetate hydrolase [Advenella kashmirensis W13003]|uniref:Fumarylacetoacetate hydrolase n=1 Tax=Advenella kashmirensis W13003 TaxID=1424334 RepID=V8QP66_9BURK|nr:fumarylacetoacetate hydrolase family protein [Advenella kashmirensis]ETF01095.1 fumarylacetoacetate hydrolase [Advenella kashmirensis W13003]
MRFVTFEHDGVARAGVIAKAGRRRPGDYVIDGAHPLRPAPLRDLKPTMQDWIGYGLQALSVALRAEPPADSCLLPLADVKLLAPLPDPGKIVGAAFNYRDGLAQINRAPSPQPVIFIKSASTIIGPADVIKIDPDNRITYEAELAVIIGKQALKISRQDVADYVCGYAIFNDVSVTNYVKQDGGFVRGKNQRTSGPLGPWIVSVDDISDPHDLAVTLDADGIRLQDSNTSQMLFRIDELIEYISAQMPLEPGDIIATGTPAGVAATHEPPAWLAPGMSLSICIDHLGELRNQVEKECPHDR